MVSPTIDLVIQFAIMFAIGAAMAIAFVSISHLLCPEEQEPQQGRAVRVRRGARGRRPGAVQRPLLPGGRALRAVRSRSRVHLSLGDLAARRWARRALVEMFVFIAILLVGYVYAWKKGVFEWE